MRSGNLDRRGQLLRRVLTRNTFGEEVVTYVAYAELWMERRDIGGREFFAAQQVNAEVTSRFRIRFRTDVLMTDRILCEGKSYNIAAPPQEIGRREGLEILGSAVVP